MSESTSAQMILMYHGIIANPSDIPENREVGAELYDVSLNDFTDQMALLKDKGFIAPFLEDHHSNNEHVILTFDDGEMNNCTNALSILKAHQFKAYFFIIAKRVGKPGYMGWDELKKLHDEGMCIGSHGLSHEILTNLKNTQIEEEMSASKKNLERNLDIEVNALSIPRGFCNDKIIDMAHNAGYKNVFISDRPKDVNATCYSRVAVKGGWTLKRFEMALHNKVPLSETIAEKTKSLSKFILRESGYNFLRKMIIKTVK